MEEVFALDINKWTEGEYFFKVDYYSYKHKKKVTSCSHSHNKVELTYVAEGKFYVNIDDVDIVLKENMFIIIDANVPHTCVNKEGKCTLLGIEFSFEKAEPSSPFTIKQLINNSAFTSLIFNSGNPYRILKDNGDIFGVLRSLIVEFDKKEKGENYYKNLLIAQLFILIGRILGETQCSESNTDLYVKKALSIIHNKYDEELSINDIAGFLNIHPVYLQRIFKNYTGKTINKYINNLRLEKAKELLTTTKKTVTEISYLLGFTSSHYFNFIFKSYFNMTPLEYRNKAHILSDASEVKYL